MQAHTVGGNFPIWLRGPALLVQTRIAKVANPCMCFRKGGVERLLLLSELRLRKEMNSLSMSMSARPFVCFLNCLLSPFMQMKIAEYMSMEATIKVSSTLALSLMCQTLGSEGT